MKYLIKHWCNVDVVAEKVVDESEIDIKQNDLKKYKTPDSTFSFVVVKDGEKIKRTTYEIYDEKLNIRGEDPSSNK